MTEGPTVRLGTSADDVALAGLRWMWAAEGVAPTMSRSEFERAFVAWTQAHRHSHTPFVADDHGEVVGMAWLALVGRVPAPDALERVGGDLQSVFVIPRLRGQGIGTRLIKTVVTAASDRGLRHLTVRAGRRSFPLYQRLGFAGNGQVLELVP